MPETPQITTIKLIPGLDTQRTVTLNEYGVSSCNLIRWMQTQSEFLVQKLGGWQKFYPFSVGSSIKALHAWQDLNDFKHLAVGATQSLTVITDGSGSTITPETTESDFTPDFTTTSGDAEVTVIDTASNLSVYDTINFRTPVSVGGLIIYGTYPVNSSIGANSYTILANALATSSDMNTGAVPEFTATSGSSFVDVALDDHGYSAGDTIDFQISTTIGTTGVTVFGSYVIYSVTDADNFVINVSNVATATDSADMNGGDVNAIYYIAGGPPITGSGYGVGGYGSGGYGTGSSSSATTGTPITATDWTLDNWGEILLANPDSGPIYQWRPNTGFRNAQVISQAPLQNTGIFISMPQQILVAYGSSNIEGLHDPLLIRWSDVANFTIWNAAIGNQAGSFRLSSGSKAISGIRGPSQNLIWTDIGVWAMTYIGYPGVFGFLELAQGCGIVGKHARGVLGGNVYWMGKTQIFTLSSSGAIPLPCSVWDVVFQNLDPDNAYKTMCAVNSMFNEVTFYYASISGGTGEIDSYVKMNLTNRSQPLWDYGTLQRTAWIDVSVLGEPIGADASGFIYQHETSENADGAALNYFWQSGAFMLSEGNDFIFLDWMLPDFKYGTYSGAQNSTAQITVSAQNYPAQALRTKGPYNATSSTTYIPTRLRGRQFYMRVEGGDLDSFIRQGNFRVRTSQDGQR